MMSSYLPGYVLPSVGRAIDVVPPRKVGIYGMESDDLDRQMTQGISANRTCARIRPGFESANEETVYLLKFRYFTTRHTSRGAAGKGPRRRTGYEREGGSTGRSNRTRPRPERVSQIGNRSNRAWHWKRAVASTSEPCLPRRCQRGFTPGPRSRSSTGRPRVRDPSVFMEPSLGPAVHRGTAP